MQALVIIPTYNEKENIAAIINAVFALNEGYEVLIIDDGSPDGTAAIVKELQQGNTALHLVQRIGKLGLGTAYIAGFKWALERTYDYIFEMDADFSHKPQDLPRLLAACISNNAGLAVGSRYIKGGKVINWPIGRILMSYFGSVYVRSILWINVKDTTAGFKCYARKTLETLPLNEIQFTGYAFQIEMKYRTLLKGFKIIEVPIVFEDRKLGTSKMGSSIFKEALLGVLKLKFQRFN
ncbi:MAG: polyprenol monophosphomannose synthase [Bacteroidia bacterium]|nr:polyprenol monophosphomannose synthase [Bacteroidia bacterium]